jgi:dolichyl-phosphate-mannose-protein mannosyltransferase
VIARFALIDTFVLLSGFGALWCYLHGRERGWRWLIATALLAGAALSVKWTGLSFAGLVLIAEGVRWLRAPKIDGFIRMAAIVLLVGAVYVASFAAHFALASHTGRDDGVMSQEFQSTLAGNPNAADRSIRRPGFLARFAELHYRMFDGTRKSIAPHPYASRWFEWPFMTRSLDLWAEHADGRIAHIYFLGNPVVWWASTYCILFLLINFPPRLANAMFSNPTPAQPRRPLERTEVAVVVAYLANMLPFMPIARVLFAYHYLPALCVALIGLGYLLDRSGVYRPRLAIGLVGLAVAGFVYIAPLTYGLPLDPDAFDARFLVPGWR